jgi:predicted N-acetyltransferase YhbS
VGEEIDWYPGPHSDLRWLFEQAEDSSSRLDGYLRLGRVLVARRGSAIVGHLQLIRTSEPGAVEINNMAVAPAHRGSGVGRALVASVLGRRAAEGWTRVVVATAAASVGNLRFYQRCGFRLLSVERDAFTPRTGYPDPITIDGIPLRDRVWLSVES